MPPLVACPYCARHVRCDEGCCPFCEKGLPPDLGQVLVPMPHRERWAKPVLAPAILVAVAASAVDCGGGMYVKYGAPPIIPEDAGPVTLTIVPDDAGARPPETTK